MPRGRATLMKGASARRSADARAALTMASGQVAAEDSGSQISGFFRRDINEFISRNPSRCRHSV